MAFQDNSGDIILDVVLTDEGRMFIINKKGIFITNLDHKKEKFWKWAHL